MCAIRNAIFVLCATSFTLGCSSLPANRPQIAPLAFDNVDDKDIVLLDHSGREISIHEKTFEWEQVESVRFRGTNYPLNRWSELDSLRAKDREDILILPFGAKKVRVFGWQAVDLANDSILILGGKMDGHSTESLNCVWSFNKSTKSVSSLRPMQAHRSEHAVALVNDGQVLIAGGIWGNNSNEVSDSCEVYKPSSQQSEIICQMKHPRYAHRLVKLTDGEILIVGGCTVAEQADNVYNLIATCELLNIAKKRCKPIGRLIRARERPQAISVENNQALIFAGEDEDSPIPIIRIEILKPGLPI